MIPNTKQQVEEYLASIEAKVGVGTDGNTSRCEATGKVYDTICWTPEGGCVKPEGKPALVFTTSTAAWCAWVAAFEEYQRTRPGEIHWRTRPELHSNRSNAEYRVYARLTIGNEDGGKG